MRSYFGSNKLKSDKDRRAGGEVPLKFPSLPHGFLWFLAWVHCLKSAWKFSLKVSKISTHLSTKLEQGRRWTVIKFLFVETDPFLLIWRKRKASRVCTRLDFDVAWAWSLSFLKSLGYLYLTPVGEESVGRICFNTIRISFFFYFRGVARIGFFLTILPKEGLLLIISQAFIWCWVMEVRECVGVLA